MKKQLFLFISFLFIYGCSSSSDGNSVSYITIGSQVWSTKNLDVSTYSDGTPIPQVTDPTAWANLTTGAWCYYDNDQSNNTVYGKLYNLYAVQGIYDDASRENPALRKKLAPAGWHVPMEVEWRTLINFLDPTSNGGYNSDNIAGGKMKATGTIQAGTGYWQSPNTGATNETGFTGLPGGSRYNNASFYLIGYKGYWWSYTELIYGSGGVCTLDYYSLGGNAKIEDYPSHMGFSVRCIKD
jgi:uncharacterized protein (TIGR02145 family)